MTSESLKKFLDAKQIEETISEVVSLTSKSGVNVALVGGVALQLYGSDRFTKDVDFVGDGEFDGLNDVGRISLGGWKGFTSKGVRVDVLVSGEFEGLYENVLAGARYEPDLGVKVARAEHIMAMKLVAGRGKDEEDIRIMLRLRQIDLTEARRFIRQNLGQYAVKEFDSFVDEVEWRRSRDEKDEKGED
jgi:hypothetical protein